MKWRSLLTGLLAGVGLLAYTAAAQAGDTFQLKMTPATDAPTLNLRGSADDADVTDVAYRGRGYGGYRGYAGGYRGYASRGYAYRYGSFYRNGYSYPRYRGSYFPRAYSSYYYGGYYPRNYYYYTPSVYYSTPYYYSPYYYSPYYYSPISDTDGATATFSLRLTPSESAETMAPPRVLTPNAPQTFPYDGGPAVPVPLPKATPDATITPPPVPPTPAPVKDRAVSLPAKSGTKFAYPAYGDTPRQTDFATQRAAPKTSR